jgi:beta-phosphoglucomutase-like phosphatase (HAD superfamily)
LPSADDIFRAAFDAWTATANKAGLPLPDSDQVQFALSVGPEDAIVTGFQWASEDEEVSDLLKSYMEELSVRRTWARVSSGKNVSAATGMDSIPMFKATPSAAKWVKSLLDVEMQCGIISYLDRDQVDVLLEQAGLSHLIARDKRVSATSGYNRDSYQMLGAALRLERRPDHCVVFDSSPYSSVAAHDVEMQSVCIIGPFPRFDLLSADTATSSFDDLSAMNIRRLFGERIYDQPMVDTQAAQPEVRRKTKIRTRFWDDE